MVSHLETLPLFLVWQTMRATLACVACDLPATRKICGFSNFNATFGCSKWMKEFVTSTFGSKLLYGGFDCENWTAWDIDTHKSKALKCQEAHTSSDCTANSCECGIKYSELLLIPHFNVVHWHVIDPMHCIFLGLAKHTLQTRKKNSVIDVSHFILLQDKVDLIIPPSMILRIPRKVESGFASFTADEWKNWILIYSVFALYKVIDNAHCIG